MANVPKVSSSAEVVVPVGLTLIRTKPVLVAVKVLGVVQPEPVSAKIGVRSSL